MASGSNKEVPRLPIGKIRISSGGDYSAEEYKVHFSAPLERTPLQGNSHGIGIRFNPEAPWVLSSEVAFGAEDLSLYRDDEPDNLELYAAIEVGDAIRFLEKCETWTPILRKYDEEKRPTGKLWLRWMLAELDIRNWIEDENRSEEDRRIIDRIRLVIAIGNLVFCLDRIENPENYRDPSSKGLPRDTPAIETLAVRGAEVGRCLQVILDEEAELAAERKLKESKLKKEAKRRDIEEKVNPKRERIKALATDAAKELYRNAGGELPRVKSVIARVRGAFTAKGEKAPGFRTVSEFVDEAFIEKACQK